MPAGLARGCAVIPRAAVCGSARRGVRRPLILASIPFTVGRTAAGTGVATAQFAFPLQPGALADGDTARIRVKDAAGDEVAVYCAALEGTHGFGSGDLTPRSVALSFAVPSVDYGTPVTGYTLEILAPGHTRVTGNDLADPGWYQHGSTVVGIADSPDYLCGCNLGWYEMAPSNENTEFADFEFQIETWGEQRRAAGALGNKYDRPEFVFYEICRKGSGWVKAFDWFKWGHDSALALITANAADGLGNTNEINTFTLGILLDYLFTGDAYSLEELGYAASFRLGVKTSAYSSTTSGGARLIARIVEAVLGGIYLDGYDQPYPGFGGHAWTLSEMLTRLGAILDFWHGQYTSGTLAVTPVAYDGFWNADGGNDAPTSEVLFYMNGMALEAINAAFRVLEGLDAALDARKPTWDTSTDAFVDYVQTYNWHAGFQILRYQDNNFPANAQYTETANLSPSMRNSWYQELLFRRWERTGASTDLAFARQVVGGTVSRIGTNPSWWSGYSEVDASTSGNLNNDDQGINALLTGLIECSKWFSTPAPGV